MKILSIYSEEDGKNFLRKLVIIFTNVKGKGKAIPLQAWTDPEVSRRLRHPDFMTIST
jgi:hypothetical protein